MLIPQIETAKAVGLVFLPGAMTDLIFAGVHPVDAVLVQAVVMFLVLGAAATNTTVIALGLVPRRFHPRSPAQNPSHTRRRMTRQDPSDTRHRSG